MDFLSLEPFIPSGKDFQKSKLLFQELGFSITWEEDNLIGFQNGNCKFILQQYDNETFAQNLMLAVKIENMNIFWSEVTQKKTFRQVWHPGNWTTNKTTIWYRGQHY